MAPSRNDAVSEDFSNDLSQQPAPQNEQDGGQGSQGVDEATAKKKRIACVLCRKRKLKCDGEKPACGTCKRLQHSCSYDVARRKSGPKRGYVKALEARLAQVETMLKPGGNASTDSSDMNAPGGVLRSDISGEDSSAALGVSHTDVLAQGQVQHNGPLLTDFSNIESNDAMRKDTLPVEDLPRWEMIGLGLDEPLPTQDVVNELDHAFFQKIQPSVPMIHRPRYYAAMHLAPHMRPPPCLRYAMWCNAASVMDKYESFQEHFYQRARRYIQQDEMKGHGEAMITLAHCQTWALIATYEFKLMYFPRAWMSAGRACRMIQMVGAHRMDGKGLDVKQCLPPPRDWTEREERRRTFWMCFCIDRYSSIGTGWPMTIDEKDILTNLPVDEQAFELSRPSKTMTLDEALDPDGVPKISSYAGVVLMATLLGRNLTHLHRSGPNDCDESLGGGFWKRHRAMENILLNTALKLPDQLRLPAGLHDPNIIFLNLCIHTSAICLHQAAIFKADKNRMPASISAESKVRCIGAASQTAAIMRSICHLDLSPMNPFISFSLYVAARVFVQYLKSRPKDEQVRSSLQFLLSAMQAIKRKNPLTESFLVQLDVDLEAAGLQYIAVLKAQTASRTFQGANRTPGCPYEHLGMGSMIDPEPGEQSSGGRRPAYGDYGLAKYNDPNFSAAAKSGNNIPPHGDLPAPSFEMGEGQFDLPSRQQHTPGSGPDSIMDTSPDRSAERHTPSSASNQNSSSRASNMAYSPQIRQQDTINMQGAGQGLSNGRESINLEDTTFTPFTAGFDISNDMSLATGRDLGDHGFVLPQDWTESTGLTSGMSFGTGSNNMDAMMMGMSESDWTQMIEGLTGTWEVFPEHNEGQFMRH